MRADRDRMAELVLKDAVLISRHARIRMFERNIRTDDIIGIITDGEVIEEYHDDEPCPSLLILGFIGEKAYHAVAICDDHVRLITTYAPSEEKWTNVRTRIDTNDS
ncbi:MAG: DUF4258 domain-containing protein [Methanomicrobiaceae archaeon]|nr:DUF4258 domain-containing protein [Methanomicrobiaceae archaeon]